MDANRELQPWDALLREFDPPRRRLLTDLLAAILKSGSREYEEPHPVHRRRGAKRVVDALLQLATELNIDRRYRRPLADIGAALQDANRGVSHSLFEPQPIDTRPGVPAERLRMMENAALAMDCLMKAGRSKQDAASRVATELGKWKVPLGGKTGVPEWKTVSGWRDKLSQAAKSGEDQKGYWAEAGQKYKATRKRLLGETLDKAALEPLALARLEKIRRSMARSR